MLLIKKQGFTLIELMVVIVIIGVLASLAIPRFTEASLKAKVAEAPGILKGFESAYLAAVAEKGESDITGDDLIYSAPSSAASKWFTYTEASAAATTKKCTATATGNLKSNLTGSTLETEYVNDEFVRTGSAPLTKLVPNFARN